MVNSLTEESDEDGDMYDETTFIVIPEQDPCEVGITKLAMWSMNGGLELMISVLQNADKTTLVIPAEEIQGFLRETGMNSRPRTGIKVKKENGKFLCSIC